MNSLISLLLQFFIFRDAFMAIQEGKLTVSPTSFMYVSTAFVAKVLPLKMRFSFSVTGVCVCMCVWVEGGGGGGGGGGNNGYMYPLTVQV